MAAAAIALRRVASQRIAAGRLERPVDVVRWLAAVQAQDYHQALWAVGSRLRAGTSEQVEHAIAERQIVRTWLMRGTIHFAAAEDVRWLLALCVPRLAASEARRCAQLGLTPVELERCAELLRAALSGDRRLSRPEIMRLLEDGGIETTGQRGYHILARMAHDALICIGPMQGKQATFVLLDEWAPRAESRELTTGEALADLATRFVSSRGPVTDHDLARWAGITLTDARQGLRDAGPALAVRSLDGTEHWLAADAAATPPPRADRRRALLLAGFDEFVLGYKNRDAQLAPEHAGKVVPGANGIFKPIVVVGGQVVGTWGRSVRPKALTITLQPFTATAPGLAEQVAAEAGRYRAFLGLPAACVPIVRTAGP